jgi:hypothetical protein
MLEFNKKKYSTLIEGIKASKLDEICNHDGRIHLFCKHNLQIHVSVTLVIYNSTKGKLADMFIDTVAYKPVSRRLQNKRLFKSHC